MTHDLLGNVVPVPYHLHNILDSPSLSIWQRLQESWASLVTREDREWSQPWNDHKRQLRNYSTLYHSAIKLSVLKVLHNFSRWNCLWDSLTVYFPVYLLNDISDARTEKYSLDHWVCFDPGAAVDLLTPRSFNSHMFCRIQGRYLSTLIMTVMMTVIMIMTLTWCTPPGSRVWHSPPRSWSPPPQPRLLPAWRSASRLLSLHYKCPGCRHPHTPDHNDNDVYNY